MMIDSTAELLRVHSGLIVMVVHAVVLDRPCSVLTKGQSPSREDLGSFPQRLVRRLITDHGFQSGPSKPVPRIYRTYQITVGHSPGHADSYHTVLDGKTGLGVDVKAGRYTTCLSQGAAVPHSVPSNALSHGQRTTGRTGLSVHKGYIAFRKLRRRDRIHIDPPIARL